MPRLVRHPWPGAGNRDRIVVPGYESTYEAGLTGNITTRWSRSLVGRHLVCLSFDFDAVSLWMALGQTSPTPISRGEFGPVGVERILKLLDRHQINSTFFIPGVTLRTYPEACQAIAAAGHEIGHHGFSHTSPRNMTRDEEHEALVKGNHLIRELTGNGALGYRSPAWDLSPDSVDLLLEEGFVYDSSMMAHDYLPYQARSGDEVDSEQIIFGRDSELIELPISWSMDDFPHFEYFRGGGLQIADHVVANWIGDFKFMCSDTDWGVLTYTFHPSVIGRGHRMLMLHNFIDALKLLGAVFVTAEAAVREYQKRPKSHP